MPTFTAQIAASLDNGTYNTGGTLTQSTTGASLRIGDASATDFDRHTYLRFPGVTIPKGTAINSATISLVANNSVVAGSVPNIRVVGEAADNPASPTSQADAAGRARTAANVPWVLGAAWATGTTYTSPNLAAVIQEIVNRTGWVSGNALQLFLMDDQAGQLTGQITAQSYDGAPASAAVLTISYGVVNPPGAPTGVTANGGPGRADVSWTAPASDGGAAITSFTVTASTGQVATVGYAPAASALFTGLAAGSVTFTVVANNSAGPSPAATSAAATVTTPPQYARPTADITTTGWAGSTAATPLASLVDEAASDDGDYVTSPTNPSGSVVEFKVNSLATPGDGNGWLVLARLRYRGGTSGSAVLALVQGTTVIASATVTLTSSFATYQLPVTAAQAAAITDLTDLRVRATVTAA